MLAVKSLLIVASAFWSAESHGPFCVDVNFPMLVVGQSKLLTPLGVRMQAFNTSLKPTSLPPADMVMRSNFAPSPSCLNCFSRISLLVSPEQATNLYVSACMEY
jgi:hypothetical protein